uniref:Uncharacterized protein n=1 Tax=Aplanochytrium stocchinoi TaxID=215587 RepID=A0A7S3LS61_9STRA|mmetsp:Transcript_15113/g.18689  ORF Transcript_15113/g.18689 Transcript_15113/m.18689 type:complete len:385 (-) Transcript_15113:297-1451(-)
MSECLKLWPGTACGPWGTCVPRTNSSGFMCLCDAGISQSKELSSFIVDENLLDTSLCTYNNTVVLTLYVICAASTAILLALQLYVIGTRKQLRSLAPAILSLVCYFLASVYRASSGALFGDDYFFSFLIANGLGFNIIAVHEWLVKYFHLLVNKSEWSSANVEIQVTRFKKIGEVLKVLDLVFSQLAWITCFTETNESLILFRIFCGYNFLRHVHILFFVTVFVWNVYYKDLEKVALFKMNLPQNTKIAKADQSEELKKWMKHYKRKAIRIVIAAFSLATFGFWIIWMPLFSDFWLLGFWTYVIPIWIMFWVGVSMFFLFAGYKRSKQNLRMILSYSYNKKVKQEQGFGTRNNFKKHLEANGTVRRQQTDHGSRESLVSEDELI